MSESEANTGNEPELYVPLSKIRETAKRIMKESDDLVNDSADYRLGQWSGAEKLGFALDAWATTHRDRCVRSERKEIMETYPRIIVNQDVVWLQLGPHDIVNLEALADYKVSDKGRIAVRKACEKARAEAAGHVRR